MKKLLLIIALYFISVIAPAQSMKISALPAITPPLAGTEVLPIVQGGITKKVTVDQLSKVHTVKVTIPSAQVLTIYSVPVVAIASPGAGYFIKVTSCSCKLIFNSVAYTTGLDLQVSTNTANNTEWLITGALNGTLTANKMGIAQSAIFASDTQLISNQSVIIQGASGADPLLGNSNIVVYITYEIVAD